MKRNLKALLPLAVFGLIAMDLAAARREPMELAPDAFFESIDATSAASITSHVAIIRSDNAQLTEPVSTTARLTGEQIQDMVFTALRTDLDWQTGRPRLAEKIAQTRLERDSCWVVVKSNLVGYPGRALYTQGDQTDIRVTMAVLTYLADSTAATRISMLACGGYKDDYKENDIFEKSLFASSGLRWNKYFWDLPDDFAFQQVIDELSQRHPDKIVEGINLNYDEIYENGRPYRLLSLAERSGLSRLVVPVPTGNGIGALWTTNIRDDDGYVPTAAIYYSDILVNIPVMKTTGKVGVNGAMKNYIGSVSRGVYSGNRGGSLGILDHGPATEDHAHTLEKTVINLFSYHPSDYIVYDALVGLEGDGSHPKTNGSTGWVRRNFIMVGENPVATESVAAASMGLNPRDLDILLWGRAKGWGNFELATIDIQGDPLDDVRMEMMHPINYTNYTAGYYYGRGNRRWLINGPYEGSDIDVDYLGNEAQANPTAGDVQAGGRSWRPHFAPRSFVDLWAMYEGDIAGSTVYAFTRAYSERDQIGELWVGASRGIQVYVNGELLISRSVTGGHAWKGATSPVSLVAGDNRILVKVTHGAAASFGFSLALVDDGLGTSRATYIPHTGKHTLGEPVTLTPNRKRRSFGGDTLPGLLYHLGAHTATAVSEAGAGGTVPDTPALHQNYPNPFNARTVLAFDMPSAAEARLTIHDALGRQVRALAAGTQAVGSHQVTWDGLDDAGRPTASGVYIARLTTESGTHARKMTLVR